MARTVSMLAFGIGPMQSRSRRPAGRREPTDRESRTVNPCFGWHCELGGRALKAFPEVELEIAMALQIDLVWPTGLL